MVPAGRNTWEGPSLPKDPEEISLGEASLKKVSLKDIPLRQWGKAFQVEESRYSKAWEQGPRREKEAGKTSWHQIVDALICLAMNFNLSIN